MSVELSIAVCTINPDQCLRMLKSLSEFVNDCDQIMVFIDGQQFLTEEDPLLFFCQKNNIEFFINESNLGLSVCRNNAMQRAKNRWLVFFDDDTVLTDDVLTCFRKQFECGKTLGGARLVMPEAYKKKAWFLSPGYSYLFGIHNDEEKIWGACFGFDNIIAINKNLKFDEQLGRKGSGLQSGDDTQFIKEYRCINDNVFFIQVPVLHYFNPQRFTFKYIMKRVFWQGRSEFRRRNFNEGWKKERQRSGNFQNAFQFATMILLRTTFLFGGLWEKILKYGRRASNEQKN